MLLEDILVTVKFLSRIHVYLNDVVDHDEATDYEGLSNFDTVYASIYVNSISTKDRYIAHVNLV